MPRGSMEFYAPDVRVVNIVHCNRSKPKSPKRRPERAALSSLSSQSSFSASQWDSQSGSTLPSQTTTTRTSMSSRSRTGSQLTRTGLSPSISPSISASQLQARWNQQSQRQRPLRVNTLTPGLMYSGVCSNKDCAAYSSRVRCFKGKGVWRPKDDIVAGIVRCPACKTRFEILEFNLYMCSARISYCLSGEEAAAFQVSHSTEAQFVKLGSSGKTVCYKSLVFDVKSMGVFKEKLTPTPIQLRATGA